MATLLIRESRDVDDQARSLDGFRQSYEQIGCGRFHGRVWQWMTDDGFMLREAANRGLRQHFSPPPDHVALAVPLSVQPDAVFAGRPLARESLMVLSPHEEYDLVSAGELDVVGLSVHRRLVDALAPAKAEWLRRAQAERHLALSPDAAAAIRLTLITLAAQAEQEAAAPRRSASPAAADDADRLGALLTQTVLLAMAGCDADTAGSIPRRAETRARVVRRAIDFMRAHLHDDIGVPEVCAAACASRRTLQYGFEEMLHTTPQAYLRALRLNEARRLLKAQPGLPITGLANALGFASASHFTQHYKRMFDELPSQTVRAGGVAG
jgi:AraC family ethanolamine operon transcriptional activator